VSPVKQRTDPETKQMAKHYLRKAGVAARYGVNVRSIDRWVELKKIPTPIYLSGSRLPLWDVDALDANDREAAARGRVASFAGTSGEAA
jgi:hypothetical protein